MEATVHQRSRKHLARMIFSCSQSSSSISWMQGKICLQPVDASLFSLCQIVEISLFPWTCSWKGYYWTLGSPKMYSTD